MSGLLKSRALIFLVPALVIGVALIWLWLPVSRPPVPAASPRPESTRAPGERTVSSAAASPTPALPEATPEPPSRVSSAVVAGQVLVRSTPAPAKVVPPSRALAGTMPAEKPGASALQDVRTMVHDYRTRLGENPIGSNAEIMRAIMGGNTAGARLGPPPGQSLNAEGELVDEWGTPYFFHQLSADKMEVRSAGPDHKLWTPDDLISR